MQRTPSPGAAAEPEIDPAALAVAEEYLREKNVPNRPEWHPSTLAADLGGTARTWRRRCESGELCAVREDRDYIVVRPWLLRYFAIRMTPFSLN